jgi:hypothetical protein
MKIYILKPDTNYRLLYPEDSVYDSEEWEFKAEPLIEKLPKQFKAYFDKDSKKPIPDIAYLGMSTFAFKKDVATELVEILEDAGELLPFYVDDALWYCLNVTKQSDALDPEKSKYEINNGVRFGLKEYAFNEDKIITSEIFKISNDNFTNIFCSDLRENDSDVENNLFCAIASHGYKGIKFEEVYSTEEN